MVHILYKSYFKRISLKFINRKENHLKLLKLTLLKLYIKYLKNNIFLNLFKDFNLLFLHCR